MFRKVRPPILISSLNRFLKEVFAK
jgi:hypothetical protein